MRWVNYLHPGLKRGKLSSQEERLVLELHSKWGNRWSTIAKKLNGRTDNEIKNYWRTHMRKKAQEMRKHKRMISLSSSSTFLCDSSSSQSMSPLTDQLQSIKTTKTQKEKTSIIEDNLDGSAGEDFVNSFEEEKEEDEAWKAHSMDQIWKEIAPNEMMNGVVIPDENFRFDGGTCPSPLLVPMASPMWDYQYEDQVLFTLENG